MSALILRRCPIHLKRFRCVYSTTMKGALRCSFVFRHLKKSLPNLRAYEIKERAPDCWSHDNSSNELIQHCLDLRSYQVINSSITIFTMGPRCSHACLIIMASS